MFIYAWISGPLCHVIGFALFEAIDYGAETTRNLKNLYEAKNDAEIIELIMFGVPITEKDVEYVLSAWSNECTDLSCNLFVDTFQKYPNVYARVLWDSDLLSNALDIDIDLMERLIKYANKENAIHFIKACIGTKGI